MTPLVLAGTSNSHVDSGVFKRAGVYCDHWITFSSLLRIVLCSLTVDFAHQANPQAKNVHILKCFREMWQNLSHHNQWNRHLLDVKDAALWRGGEPLLLSICIPGVDWSLVLWSWSVREACPVSFLPAFDFFSYECCPWLAERQTRLHVY